MTNKEDFLRHSGHIHSVILLAAAANFVYRWGDDLAYKQQKIENAFEEAKCYLRIMLTEDEHEREGLRSRFEKLYKVEQHRGFAAEDETKRLVMPIGFAIDELSADELKEIGFRKWDDERDADGRTLWLCPLWLAPFLKCGQPIDSIIGRKGLTILPPDQMDMDHRAGLCSWGFKLKA